MSDYPETVREFRAWFPDDEACRRYLERIRWPSGPRCPRCPQAEVWAMKGPFYRCAACRHDFTVTAGTPFGDTRLPWSLWFEALWYVVNQKQGASALGWPSRRCVVLNWLAALSLKELCWGNNVNSPISELSRRESCDVTGHAAQRATKAGSQYT